MKLIKKYFLITVMVLSLIAICGCTKTNTTKLDKPTNLVCDSDYILTWDSVENATGYTVLVGTKSFTVTTNSADLKDYLSEGKNNVWVTATSTDSKYTTSEGASIVVTYDPFTAKTLIDSLTEQYKEALASTKDSYANEEEFNAHCIAMATESAAQFATLCAGANVTIKQVLALNSLVILASSDEMPEVTAIFDAIDGLRESEISHRTLAKITYNGLQNLTTIPNEPTTLDVVGIGDDASPIMAIVTIFATNEGLTVDTLEVVYEYLDKALLDIEKAYNELVASEKQDAMYTFAQEVIKALLGENRPRVTRFTTLVTFFKQYLAMYVATEKDNIYVQTLPDVFNFVVSIIDPVLDIVYKASTALTTTDMETIMASVMTIVECVQALTPDMDEEITEEQITENVKTIIENVQIIMATASTATANVDISTETEAIATALATLVNSESVQNVIKQVAIMVIQMVKPDVTAEKAEEMYNKICEVIANINDETTPEQVISQILAALEMTKEEATQLVLNTIASAVVSNIETPEEAEEIVKGIAEILDVIGSLEQPETGVIKVVDILKLIPEEYQDIVASLFPDADQETVIPAEVVTLVKQLLGVISEQATAKVEELSDHILEQYVGEWNVTTEETDTPLFTSVIITEHSMYLDGNRATNVEYSGNDYYGYTVYVNGTAYYVSLSGERLLIASPTENKDTEYTKAETPVDPSDTIPTSYQGTFTAEKDGVTYTLVVTETTITFNDVEFVIESYDDYEGFTGTLNGETYYVMLGYGDGEIMVVSGDYSFNVTLKVATTDQPSGDQTISADWVGTYEGTKDEVTYQVVLTAETITINGTETTITKIDGNDIFVTYNGEEWSISFAYGPGTCYLANSNYSVFVQCTIVK